VLTRHNVSKSSEDHAKPKILDAAVQKTLLTFSAMPSMADSRTWSQLGRRLPSRFAIHGALPTCSTSRRMSPHRSRSSRRYLGMALIGFWWNHGVWGAGAAADSQRTASPEQMKYSPHGGR
jgi:hypothetical protein